MAKRCKYIYKGKTYTKEEFMAMLAGGEYENLLAEYEQDVQDLNAPSKGMNIKSSIIQNNPVYFNNLKEFASNSSFANKIEFKKAIQGLLNSYLPELKKQYGKSFDPSKNDELTKKYLSDAITNEAVKAIEEHPEAIGWYDEKTRAALDVISAIHPEIATDKESRGSFILPLAVMSNGNLVDFNFDLAEKQYNYFKNNGRFNPEGGFGLQQSGIKKSLLLINSLLDNGLSMADINTFLTSKYRAGDLKVKVDGKIKSLASGELADEMVYGATILGPKIGNGFYMNLWGQFDQLTMDRWFMRTWGRLTGTLLKTDAKAIADGKKRVSDALAAIKSNPAASEILKSIFKKVSGMSPVELAKAVEKASVDKDSRTKLASNPKTDELRKAGNQLSKNISGEKEAPANGNERKFIREVFNNVQNRLKTEHDIEISMADLQAVLWYPEKILYESFKGGQTFEEASEGYTSESAPDYFNAAKKLATKLGKNETEINEALSRGRERAQRSIGTGNTTARGSASAADKEALGRVTEVISGKFKQSKGIGKFDPLPGAPKTEGITGPDPNLVSVAENYAKKFGIPFTRQAEYVKVDEDRAKRIADAYENMKHDPKNPKVLEAFNDLIRQTKDQYDALTEAGYEFSFFDGDTDPYNKNPSKAMRDLRNNKKMAVYGTYAGYGTEGITGASIEGNPMLQDTGLKWKDQNGVDQTVTMNDLFRAVHDAFGHGLEGAGFRARGEENAWQAHVRLFTGPAVAAITTETRGQNSWLNYGPFGEQNRKATVDDTVFAEQKTGLMPEWTWNEGKAEAMPEQVDDQDTQAVADSSALFEKSQELFEKISDAAGGSKKRSLAEERRKFMDENPDIKFMDENMAYIYRQIEDNNLGKKEGNCPL
jgi:hypothetical protein